MKRKGALLTTLFLVVVIGVILAVLFREAASGPTFRAEDYGSMGECMANIPAEWAPGSLERSGAETACAYVHRPRNERRR